MLQSIAGIFWMDSNACAFSSTQVMNGPGGEWRVRFAARGSGSRELKVWRPGRSGAADFSSFRPLVQYCIREYSLPTNVDAYMQLVPPSRRGERGTPGRPPVARAVFPEIVADLPEIVTDLSSTVESPEAVTAQADSSLIGQSPLVTPSLLDTMTARVVTHEQGAAFAAAISEPPDSPNPLHFTEEDIAGFTDMLDKSSPQHSTEGDKSSSPAAPKEFPTSVGVGDDNVSVIEHVDPNNPPEVRMRIEALLLIPEQVEKKAALKIWSFYRGWRIRQGVQWLQRKRVAKKATVARWSGLETQVSTLGLQATQEEIRLSNGVKYQIDTDKFTRAYFASMAQENLTNRKKLHAGMINISESLLTHRTGGVGYPLITGKICLPNTTRIFTTVDKRMKTQTWRLVPTRGVSRQHELLLKV